MVLASQRSALSGPTLVRLLAGFGGTEVTESRQSLADHLSQWLGWTDAIALSTALSVQVPPARAGAARVGASVEQAEVTRLRTALTRAIAGNESTARRDGRDRRSASAAMAATAANADSSADPAPDYAEFRQRYLVLQQAMESDIGALRARLRSTLAARAPKLAHLATVDAVMEQALAAREQRLLASVPALLGAHFERLRAAAELPQDTPQNAPQDADTPAEAAAESANANAAAEGKAKAANTAAPGAHNAWLAGFRKDMQSVLLAELEIRFQPVEGLLAALRTS
ncbi:DUF3348 domain-containing protein [Paraburkholderia acidisoli]|uniref:DUF3348 family protein n=1 Tax=Paraburkholderia acidisoli TaxID=2571748 RepID=A0A7Z2JIM3_9BURK|nr:DUF3348 domain-containing protein [Paraburkholderia acidisoli]QGZ64490.1 DUF3348 family protein [Paraburkholderia acidisoli]